MSFPPSSWPSTPSPVVTLLASGSLARDHHSQMSLVLWPRSCDWAVTGMSLKCPEANLFCPLALWLDSWVTWRFYWFQTLEVTSIPFPSPPSFPASGPIALWFSTRLWGPFVWPAFSALHPSHMDLKSPECCCFFLTHEHFRGILISFVAVFPFVAIWYILVSLSYIPLLWGLFPLSAFCNIAWVSLRKLEDRVTSPPPWCSLPSSHQSVLVVLQSSLEVSQ